MTTKHLKLLGLAALFLAWCFDLFFWQRPPGISFFIYVALCLAGGLLLTGVTRKRPPLASWLLLLPALLFAFMTAVRLEPFTLLVDFGLALGSLVVLSLTWLGGYWWQYSLLDYTRNGLRLAGDTLAMPVRKLLPALRAPAQDSSAPNPSRAAPAAGRPPQRAVSVLFGLLLAFPVLWLLTALLAQADPIFSEYLRTLLRIFDLERLSEYLFRLTYILAGAYLLAGVFLHALISSPGEAVSWGKKPWLTPFMGWLEALTLLLSVDALFAFFVAVQFRYFFGGQANIHLEGFTYAEYARRGFSELVVVAVISLLVFLTASAITRRSSGSQQIAFSAAGIGLVGLVSIILVSAFQRLLLYEAAYGFSRIRTYTHIFMIWLGLLLLVTALLEGLKRLQFFPLAAVLAAAGFGLTLNVLNVDAFIVRQNVTRAAQGAELDFVYLAQLSEDAVPGLFAALHDPRLPQPARHSAGLALACRRARLHADSTPQSWPSYHASRQQAQHLFSRYEAELDRFPVYRSERGWVVVSAGQERSCDWYSHEEASE